MSPFDPVTFADAVRYAAEVHADQTRKRADDDPRPRSPYIGHLLGVAGIVIEDMGSHDEAVAALLHDVLEDRDTVPPTRGAEIEQSFGPAVLAIVEACSGLKKEDDPNFRSRKRVYLDHLAAETNTSAIKVSLADKVHNARSTVNDLEEDGPIMWDRFNSGAHDQLWWYARLAEHYLEHARNYRASQARADELGRLAAQMRALTSPE